METRTFFDLAYFTDQVLNGELENGIRYFTAFVRDELAPGIGVRGADPKVTIEILFEMRKCQVLEMAQFEKKDQAAQVLAEFILPLLENYDLVFGGDAIKLGMQLAKLIAGSKEQLVELMGSPKERRKELMQLIRHKLFRIPRITRALHFSKKVEAMDIMSLLKKPCASRTENRDIEVGFLLGLEYFLIFEISFPIRLCTFRLIRISQMFV